MDDARKRTALAAATNGDRDALQRLIVCYHRTLRAAIDKEIEPAARRFVEPEDVLQDAYAAAYTSIAECRFDDPAQFYRWLERIALNTLRNKWRALKRQKRDVRRLIHAPAATSTYPDLLDRLSASGGSPSRLAGRSEATAAVVSSLARLTEDQRGVIRLRFFEELPVAEVAKRLGKSEGAVHALCMRALRALREHLGTLSDFLSRL